MLGVQEVPGSNPGGPTKRFKELETPPTLPPACWSPFGVQNGVHASGYPSLFRRLPRLALCYQRLGIHGVHGCHQRGLVRWWREKQIAYKGTTTSTPSLGLARLLDIAPCPVKCHREASVAHDGVVWTFGLWFNSLYWFESSPRGRASRISTLSVFEGAIAGSVSGTGCGFRFEPVNVGPTRAGTPVRRTGFVGR